MPIDLRVHGDPNACHDCAAALIAFTGHIQAASDEIAHAKAASESEWTGKAAHAFRARVAAMSANTSRVGDAAARASRTLDALGDALATVKSRMAQAAEIAAESGLVVTADASGPTAIADPPAAPSPSTAASAITHAKQVGAYGDAEVIATEARALERTAHVAAQAGLAAVTTTCHDLATDWSWAFAIAGGAVGYVGGVMEKYGKYKAVATEMNELAKTLAAAPNAGEDTQVIESAAERIAAAADREAAETARFVGGHTDSPLVTALADTAHDVTALGAAGRALPVVGSGITAVQTVYDVQHADTGAEKVKVAGRDLGGFMAGSAATELLMGSAIAGPAGLGAVAIGIGTAVVVSEAIEHWGDITRTLDDWLD